MSICWSELLSEVVPVVNHYYSDFEESTFEATGSMCFFIDMKIPWSKSPGNYRKLTNDGFDMVIVSILNCKLKRLTLSLLPKEVVM